LTPRGACGSVPAAVNNFGEVVGYYYDADHARYGFYYNPEIGVVDLATLMNASGTSDIQATDINDDNQIAGTLVVKGKTQAFRFSLDSGLLETIPALKKSRSSLLSWSPHIGQDGTVVGIARTGNWDFNAFRFSANGQMEGLGTLGGDESGATGITSDGHIVGFADLSESGRAIFLLDDAEGMRRVTFEGESTEYVPNHPVTNNSLEIISGYPGYPMLLLPE
jgi:probable HAF family extracellular repeat protein